MDPYMYQQQGIQPSSPQNTQKQSKFLKYGTTMNTILTIGIIILIISSIIGVYQLSKFFILYANETFKAPFITTDSVITWIITVVCVLLLFGILRVITTYLGNIVKFVFKIAQSDIVTIILAIAVNGLLLWLNTWLTKNIIQFIESTHIESFFSFDNFLSVIIMFVMLAGALLWIPRIGTYGENRLGQFDD